jgi:hypothetical protein
VQVNVKTAEKIFKFQAAHSRSSEFKAFAPVTVIIAVSDETADVVDVVYVNM